MISYVVRTSPQLRSSPSIRSTLIALKTLFFALLGPGTVIVLVPYLLLSQGLELRHLDLGIGHLLGWPAILTGAVMAAWCATDFVRKGKGTPAPFDPPRKLVINGLYRWTRNPMYSGALLILIGESLFFESATLFVYTAMFLFAFHLFVVYYEEPTLKRKFGADYEDYYRSVPRWIPRLKKQQP
jgi:protein-S-isoprenylcysteine O-methyltransferase Ste14